ncbi:MAG: DUF5784 family protein [Haloarculaceae archaeon]
MAGPLRFRRSTERWDEQRVHRDLYQPLDDSFGASLDSPWFSPPAGYDARRLSMDNGDTALFCWDDEGAYWLGNTETPQALWRTHKETFEEAPYPVTRWAQRELLAQLEMEDPWLAEYEYVSWFFLPVFFSKDGRESTRAFFRDHAAGFPDATREEGLAFYEDLLSTGLLDDHRYTMASKLGTSGGVDLTRMQATMGEFNAAKLLHDAGHEFVPEVDLDSGHALDFRVDDTLVEVTRPQPPARRSVGSAVRAVKASGDAKSRDQLDAHAGATLFVDCTSFPDDEWRQVLGERPSVGYEPLVVFRTRPSGRVEGYQRGSVPLAVADVFE